MLRYVVLISVFLCCLNSYSQKVSFEHLTQNDGLPSPTVTCIFKDSYGFMWFGTQRGLVKYDGYSYKVFDKVPSGITGNVSQFFFKSIVQPNDSTLLVVLSYHGFYIFNLFTETFTPVLNIHSDTNLEEQNNIYSLYIDRNKNTWVASEKGLSLFDLKTKSFIHYPLSQYSEFSITKTSGSITSILEDQRGNLWLFCLNGYIGIFNIASKQFRFVRYSNNPVASNTLNHGGTLFFDQQHTLWIGTEYEGVFCYDTLTHITKHYSTENKKLSSNVIMNFCEDNSHDLWIATDGGGLLRYNRSMDSFDVFKNNSNDPTSISSNAIYYIYESDDHILWVGTYAAGLNIYKRNKQKFNLVTAKGPPGYHLSYKSVLSFAEAPNGLIFIGTDGGGLNVFHPDTKRIDYYTTANSDIHSDIITTVYFDQKGSLWLGSYGKGFCRYTFNNGLKRSSIVLLNEKSIWRINSDVHGTLWIGSLDALYSMSYNQSGYINQNPVLQIESPFGVMTNLSIDTKGLIWMATSSGGIKKYDPFAHKMYSILSDPKDTSSLPSNNVKNIFIDSQGSLWVGTEFGGLSKQINDIKNSFHTYKVPISLFRSVNGILEDSRKHLWLSTDNGIIYMNGNGEYIPFSLDDGIQNKEFTAGALLKAKNGMLYFGGIDGFNYFDPDLISHNTRKPSVYITDIKLFNNSLIQNIPFNGQVYLSRSAFMSSDIYLNYRDNVLSIGFAALDFTAPEQNQYAYILEGFDQNWIMSDASRRYVTYTNLPPGDYVFRVKGSNNDAVWNNTDTVLNVHVLPPWWMTWWFRTLLFIVLIILILTGYYI